MNRPIAFAYSLFICSSLGLNCLTVQQTWAADSSTAATSPPTATTAAPGAGAGAATPPAPTGTTAPTGTPPAGAAPAAGASNTLAPVAAGPLKSDRSNVRNWILAAQKRGVGIGGYKNAFDDMENSVRAGEPQANIKKKLDSMLRAINDQYRSSTTIQKDRRPGVVTGGQAPYQIMYKGEDPNNPEISKKWQGKPVDQGVISEISEQAYKKALYKLTEEQRTGYYVSDEEGTSRLSPRDVDELGRRNPMQQLQLQREEAFQRHMNKWMGQVGGKRGAHNPSQMDLIRNSSTNSYYEKSKLRSQQREYAKQRVDERYGKDNWVAPPFNQGDY